MYDSQAIERIRDYERRERALAGMAADPAVAAMHRELADHYRQVITLATQAPGPRITG